MSLLKNLFKEKTEPPIKTCDDFWAWFVQHEKTFFNVFRKQKDIEKNFFDKLAPKLAELKDGFYFLTGMYDDNTVELILTADGIIKNIVFVEELVSKAPHLQGWRFTALKPALPIENVAIDMDGILSDNNNLFFYSNEDEQYPDEVNITIVHTDLNDENRSPIVSSTWLFLDNYLGELYAATAIDHADVIGKNEATKKLVPIEKLKDFLIWREKEFVEKYQGVVSNSHDMEHSIFEAETSTGARLIAAINTDILNWERKASHPWILSIEIPYDGSNNGGLPEEEINKALWSLEEKITEQLKDNEGYILIGHESVDNLRSIYFACKDFRKPSKVVYQLSVDKPEWKITYDIYKDKYWRSLNRFNPAG